MSVHYKFKSALSYDTITFDGLHISIRDLKKAILQQKQIGKASDFDLQITNAQSNEVYEDDNTLVPKNSSLIVVRIPLTTQQKKAWEKSDALPVLGNKGAGDLQDPYASKLAKTVDLANVEASEADKIQAAITQSTLDYDPSNYLRIKGSNQVGEIPSYYKCYKCNLPGHWIKDCKLSVAPPETNAADIKKSTGIPQSFMVPVEGPGVPGAMMTPTGHYAVPSIEHQARREPIKKIHDPIPIEKPAIPDDLICGVCKDLLADAVLIPCCGNSFCDECIRNVLLDSEDHQCPDCREKDVSPDTLIPNRFLRNSVNNFKNQTGYCRTTPSFTQSKLAAAHSDPVASLLPNTDVPPPAIVYDDANKAPSQPARSSPRDVVRDNGPPQRNDTISPDDIQIVDDIAPIPVASTTPAIDSEDLMSVASPISSIGQPIINLGTASVKSHLPVKHYSDSDDYHKRTFKPHYFKRHDRSDTPTVDERSHSVETFQGGQCQFPIEPIPPRMMISHRPPLPHMFPQGNYMYRPSFPHPPIRHEIVTYPPGVDHPPPRINMNYRGNSYFPPRVPRAPYRPPHAANGPPVVTVPPADDPLEQFHRMLREKERARGRSPKLILARRRSRSYSRSYSRSLSPRPRSRPPRSRSRSSTRLRSRSPRSPRSPPPRSPPPRSRSRSNIRRRSRSRSFSISRSRSPIPPPRSPRSMRSYHSRSPSRDRDRHYSPIPPVSSARRRDDRRVDRSPPPRHSPIRYYSQRYKDEYSGPPPKNERGPPLERIDRDRERDRGRRFYKPSSVVQEYNSVQDFNRGSDRYDSKDSRENRYTDRPRDRDFEKDRDRDRDRDRNFKREQRIPSLLDEPLPPHPRRYEAYDRIASDWEKTRDRELELQERERERQAASTGASSQAADYFHGDKGGPIKKREPSRGRPVESISGVVPREPVDIRRVSREPDLTYVEPRSSPLVELQPAVNKSPEKEKKIKEKKKKKSKEESEKSDKSERKKKKKKLKDKVDKKENSEQDPPSIPGVDEGEEESKQSEEVPVREDLLYGDLAANSDIVDIGVVETYTKPLGEVKEPVKDKDVVLAPVPELSKWEKDDEQPLSQSEERTQENGTESKQVTSEVLKRAENAIFKKSLNPISEKKADRKAEVKKSSKEKEKPEVKPEIVPEKMKEEKVIAEPPEKPKEKEVVKAVVVERDPRESPPKRVERVDRPDRREAERDRREDRERDRYRERREQEREREERYRFKMMERERERERHLSSTRESERERFNLGSKISNMHPVEIKMETIPLRISAKDRLGAKVEDKAEVKKRREVKTEKSSSKRKERARDSESKDDIVHLDKKKPVLDDVLLTDHDKKKDMVNDQDMVIAQNASGPPGIVPKKRSVSLETDHLAKKIKLAQGESTADSSLSSDESVSVKKHKKKKKKKHKKKKKKKKHSSSDSDSSSSSSDSEHEKKRKHKKSKKSKKRKKSKK